MSDSESVSLNAWPLKVHVGGWAASGLVWQPPTSFLSAPGTREREWGGRDLRRSRLLGAAVMWCQPQPPDAAGCRRGYSSSFLILAVFYYTVQAGMIQAAHFISLTDKRISLSFIVGSTHSFFFYRLRLFLGFSSLCISGIRKF